MQIIARDFPNTGSITGAPFAHPEFGVSFPNTADLGIVVLDQDVNWLGYGLQSVVPDLMSDSVRSWAVAKLGSLRSALTDGYNVQHSNTSGTGGGTCFGDSGGPIVIQGTNTIVAVTSFGLNQTCVDTSFAHRVDSDYAQSFIWSFQWQ